MYQLSTSYLPHKYITGFIKIMFYLALFILVEDMIKEVDVDGDGRIDFYGKYLPIENV